MAETQSTLAFDGEQSGLKSGVYRIRCHATGKVYVGSTANIEARRKDHLRYLTKGRHHSPRLQRAWNKYGADAFAFEVIERVEPAFLIAREQFHIDTARAADRRFGFNICPSAGCLPGSKLSDETKRKMSEAARNRPAHLISAQVARLTTPENLARVAEANKARNQTPEQRARTSERCKGRPLSAEHRAKLSEAARGRTQEYKEKIRATLKGRPLTPEHRAKVVAAGAGRFRTVEHRAKVSAALAGRPRSDDLKRKVSDALMGHPVSEETRARLRAAWVRRKARAEAAKVSESSTPA